MTCHLILPAAGTGRRFGRSVPKQYCDVAGSPVMDWTLRAFESLPFIGQTLLVLAPGDERGHRIAANHPRVQTVQGGQERFESVRNGLQVLAQQGAVDDWVMVHDIARPCVNPVDVSGLYQRCEQSGIGGLLAIPATDTMKRQLNDTQVETLDRTTLWSAQTPQCFRVGALLESLTYCSEQGRLVTDEASAIEATGGQVQLVEGSRRNIKLTHADDLPLIEFFLTHKESEL